MKVLLRYTAEMLCFVKTKQIEKLSLKFKYTFLYIASADKKRLHSRNHVWLNKYLFTQDVKLASV